MKDNISEDQVFEDYQNGLAEDFELQGATIRRKPVELHTATVEVSLKLTYDFLKELRQAADQEGIPYQTLIVWVLQDYVHRSSLEPRVRKIEERLAQLEARMNGEVY